jgi:hypothetical protein
MEKLVYKGVVLKCNKCKRIRHATHYWENSKSKWNYCRCGNIAEIVEKENIKLRVRKKPKRDLYVWNSKYEPRSLEIEAYGTNINS